MTFFDIHIDKLVEADLAWLVQTAFSEASVIEYKSELRFDDNEEIEKVLSQICSFANADGGDIVYGIEAEKGVPKNLVGQPIENSDGLIQRIENVLRKNVRPELFSCRARAVEMVNGNTAIVFRIRSSWSKPHQMKFNNKYAFYTRSSNGLAHLDVDELRNLFDGPNAVRTRIDAFLASRLINLKGSFAPTGQQMQNPFAVIHIVPMEEFAKENAHDPLIFADHDREMVPISRGAFNKTFNFDGYLYSSGFESKVDFFSQGFRDLSLEVGISILSQKSSEGRTIQQMTLAHELFLVVNNALKFYRQLSVSPPLLLRLLVIGANQCTFGPIERLFVSAPKKLDRNLYQFPDVFISDLAQRAEGHLRSTLDIFWQAAGYGRCYGYDENGEWIE